MKRCFVAGLFLFLFVIQVVAQELVSDTRIECGAVVEAEYTVNQERHNYLIELAPGDRLRVTTVPLGDRLGTLISLYDPTNIFITRDGSPITNGIAPKRDPAVDSGVLSARGVYTIAVTNYGYYGNNVHGTAGTGIYTLLVGCTLRDNTIIDPGDPTPIPPLEATATPAIPPTSVAPPPPSRGFPGLAPVDFAQGVTFPMTLGGAPNLGNISEGFVGILGYTFSATQGDQFALSLTRQSGNLNLGIAVISANNVVVFESSLMNASILITQFTIPVTGEYTIGVYRSSLLQPTDAQATTFQITGAINP